jgi:hypothetical protein
MNVFISWSGETSHSLAEALRDWLPSVIQRVHPFLSSDDIESGARWAQEIGHQLDSTDFGIICLTKESLNAPWLVFEAGALAKSVGKSLVCPIVLGIQKSDVSWPLAQFQSEEATEPGIRKLLVSLNRRLGDDGLSESQLDEAFGKWWPDLAEVLSDLNEANSVATEAESDSEPSKELQILEELLELSRYQARVLSERARERDWGEGARAARIPLTRLFDDLTIEQRHACLDQVEKHLDKLSTTGGGTSFIRFVDVPMPGFWPMAHDERGDDADKETDE